jgi:hypothetical protein
LAYVFLAFTARFVASFAALFVAGEAEKRWIEDAALVKLGADGAYNF